MQNTEKDVRVYELSYWLVPSIPDTGIEARVAELKSVLTGLGAEFISEESAYLREIAYEMCKVINNQNHYFTEGYFGWVKFELEPAQTAALKKAFDLDQDVIRYMLIQTVRENTVYTKRPAALKKEESEEGEVVEEVAVVESEVEAEEVSPVVAA